MFGLPGIVVLLALGGVPADRTFSSEQGFSALCRGPWMQADSETPYRGVLVEDNGSGQCCNLGIRRAFVCETSPGHQHGPIIRGHLRFFDGASSRPRLDLVISASPNPGMDPDRSKPFDPPFAVLHLQRTDDGFALTFVGRPDCRMGGEACTNAGRWVFGSDGIPSRAD